MIYKLITFKPVFQKQLVKVVVRLLFLFMASNEVLNMKAKKARSFLYFSFLIFLRYSLVGIQPSKMLRNWVRYDLIEPGKSKKSFQRPFICVKNDLIEIALFPQGHFHYFLSAFIRKQYDFSQHGCSNHLNSEMETECLTKTLSYLSLNISRTKNSRNKL